VLVRCAAHFIVAGLKVKRISVNFLFELWKTLWETYGMLRTVFGDSAMEENRFLSGFLDSKVRTVRLTIVRFEVVPPQITQQNVEKGHRIVNYNEV
jgi:hypothetical protein